jgi:cytochrome c oxidase subunit 1
MFTFFNLTFFPLFLVGLFDQPRRVFEYAHQLQGLNDFSSVSAFLLAASFLVFVANFVWSVFISPVKAPDNPWDANGLEWQTANPVPPYNFEHIPVVLADPYHYGEAASVPVADLAPEEFAMAGSAPAPDPDTAPGVRGPGPGPVGDGGASR